MVMFKISSRRQRGLIQPISGCSRRRRWSLRRVASSWLQQWRNSRGLLCCTRSANAAWMRSGDPIVQILLDASVLVAAHFGLFPWW